VKGHGPSWIASITANGAYYLEHRSHQPREDHIDPNDNGADRRSEPRQEAGPALDCPAVMRSRKPPASKQGPVDQLMQSLREAADHRILVPTEKEPHYRRLVAAAKRHGRIPDGMQVSIEYIRHDNNSFVAVALEPLPEWQIKLLAPYP
jgi:hypothetical protein